MCMKSVNQCIGRAIRHANDYACIFLIDRRYQSIKIQAKLPKWIRDSGVLNTSYDESIDETKVVFSFLFHYLYLVFFAYVVQF